MLLGLLLLAGLSWVLGGLLLLLAVLLLLWWRRTGAGWRVVRHAFVARMGVLLLLLLPLSLAGWLCSLRSLARSLASLLGSRGMRFADGRGGCGGGTGTCAVLEAAHHHRACRQNREEEEEKT